MFHTTSEYRPDSCPDKYIHHPDHSWSKISTIMQFQQCATVSINAKKDKKIYARVCARPNKEAVQIYEALGWKHRPYIKKLNVVTQL